MKTRVLSLLTFIIFATSSAFSQKTHSKFLFEEFQDAVVYQKGNTSTKAKMNYNLVTKKLSFIDSKTNDIKDLSDELEFIVVEMAKRQFVKKGDDILEVLPTTPTIYVQYLASSLAKKPVGAYGGTSHTSSVTAVGYFDDGNRITTLEREVEVSNFRHVYWIEKDSKTKQFNSFKQLTKIYSKHKAKLEEYINTNKPDFNNVDDIVKLCTYAESL